MNENPGSNPRQLGDYRLTEQLSQDDIKVTWLAEQVSVGRQVILDELLDPSADNRAGFLADTRARAAVDHPFIASVYEAVDSEGYCLRASERLTGRTLQSMLDEQSTVEPAVLARALRCIAEACLHHETNGRSTQEVEMGHIHFEPGGVARMANLAAAGARGEAESARDVQLLGRALVPLVADGRPGATRMLTVLAWMRGKDRPAPLDWVEVIALCDEIDRQLSEPIQPVLAESKIFNPPPGGRRFFVISGLVTAALAAVFFISWLIVQKKPVAPGQSNFPPVLIPAGDYPAPDGSTMRHEAFLMDARETTIAEYREFLGTLEVLAEEGRHQAFDHPEQPAEKTNHAPDDWDALLAAARARGQWNGKQVTLDSPVFGVDWWDAMAYANWRNARLPTQEEWFAAMHHESDNPAAIPPSPWRAFAEPDCPDKTPAGIRDVAGSLSEWTRETSISPVNPLGSPQHVIIGGSYLRPSGNALSREWTPDPGLRRPDLGFRLVRDAPEAD